MKNKVKQIRLEIRQKEYDGESHNVIAELPGKREEWIVLSAHYDTTSLSHGAYDNMSGCAGLLGIMEQMKGKELNYGLRFVFCGSEERGLLGAKAYVRDHEKELRQIVLNINLDMIGTYMGKFIACVSAEEKLTHYISYMAAEVGFPIAAENGVYSSCRSWGSGCFVCAYCQRKCRPDSLPLRCQRCDVDGAAAKRY